MKSRFPGTLILLFTTCSCFAQPAGVIVPGNLAMPEDSVVKTRLLSALNAFLEQVDSPNRRNSRVLPGELPATSALLDEMKQLGSSENGKQDHFFRSHLVNVTPLSDTNWLIQLAYLGASGDKPGLRALFTLSARSRGDSFYFCSPLKSNTTTWKTARLGTNTIFYKKDLDSVKAAVYFDRIAAYDRRLKAPGWPTDFYCADNFPEVLQLLGVDYKSDYSGLAKAGLGSKENMQYLVVDGSLTAAFTRFDPHDLWHDRLHNVLSPDIINRAVDEGTAYLYGGTWGISWQEIREKFTAYARENPKADWLTLYNDNVVFAKTGAFPLYVSSAVNALLAEKIEREQGFPAVLRLLSCGKKQKDNENYYVALRKITGIKKSGFNKAVNQLIAAK